MDDLKELPEGWKWVKLGDVCEIIMGQSPPSDTYNDEERGLPFFQGKAEFTELHPIVKKWCASPNKIAQPNDILLSVRAPVGSTNIANVKCCIGRGLAAIRFNNFKYVYYYLKSIQEQLDSKGTGTTFRAISGETVKTTYFPLPPKEIQDALISKIEELFSELDKGIENLRLAQQQLKTYRQAVLKSGFEGRLTNDDVKEEELPKGWKSARLKEICAIKGGVTKGKDYKKKPTILVPYLRVANVQDGFLDLKEIKYIEVLPEDQEKYRLIAGDILYTEGGDKDKLGRGTIWRNEIKDCIHQNHIFRARPLSCAFSSIYISFFSQTKAAKDYFFKHGKQTTNLASINLNILSNLPVPIGDIEEQLSIVKIIETKFSVANKIEEDIQKSIHQSEILRLSILKQAFVGKLLREEKDMKQGIKTMKAPKLQHV